MMDLEPQVEEPICPVKAQSLKYSSVVRQATEEYKIGSLLYPKVTEAP